MYFRNTCTALAPTGSAAFTYPSGKDGLTYNAKTGLYTYSWETAKSWAGTCRVLTVKLADGTSHMAYFKFK